MNTKPGQDRDRAMRMLEDALQSVPGISIARAADAPGADLEISRPGCPTLHVRLRPWDGNGSLRPHEAWLLRGATATQLQRLRDAGENFVALNGAVRLVSAWLAVDRAGLRRPRPSTPEKRVDPFSDRNSLVARALLAQPGRAWGVRELAEECGVALGTASQVVRTLARLGAITLERGGRTACVMLREPAPLLNRWFAAYAWDRNPAVAFHAPVGDASRFVRRLPALFGTTRWALTLQAGAAQVAPHATWDRVHAYVDVPRADDLHAVGASMGWEPAPDGRVVLMKPFYRTAVWRDVQTLNELPVAGTLQLALDLWHYPLRGREASEHLLRIVLGYHV